MCPQRRTVERTTSGTNNVPSGARAGLVTCKRALSQPVPLPRRQPRPQNAEVKYSQWSGKPLTSRTGERGASGFRFLEPGLNEIVKSKTAKEKSPTSLTGVKSLSGTDVLQILMIRPDNEWHAGSLEPVSPLTKSQTDRQKFSVTDVVIVLRGRKAMGVKGAWMYLVSRAKVAIIWHPPRRRKHQPQL